MICGPFFNIIIYFLEQRSYSYIWWCWTCSILSLCQRLKRPNKCPTPLGITQSIHSYFLVLGAKEMNVVGTDAGKCMTMLLQVFIVQGFGFPCFLEHNFLAATILDSHQKIYHGQVPYDQILLPLLTQNEQMIEEKANRQEIHTFSDLIYLFYFTVLLFTVFFYLLF